MKPVVLVTGATGLVGRAVVRAFGASDWSVLGCARQLPPGEGLSLDLASPNATIENSFSVPPSLVVHLAAAVPGPSMPDDEASAAMTRAMDGNVSRAVATWGCPAIYASTCGLYDPTNATLKRETKPVVPRTPYFAAKREGERKFRDRCDATVLRISSPVGPGLPPHLVLSRFVAAALAGRALAVWGSGAREQNFLWTADVAAAVIAATNSPASGIYNVAGSQVTTMIALAETVVAVVGRGHVVLGENPDPRDGETARYDISTAEQTFNWRPEMTVGMMIERLTAR